MGLFFLLFLSMNAFAADCVNSIPPTPAFCDNLYINTPLNLSASAGPIVVTVDGIVEIRANITVSGLDGSTISVSGTPGGSGGPGAGIGGGLDGLSSPEDGQDGTTANGKTPPSDLVCGNGGGGGGLFSAGDNGGVCATSTSTFGAGGGVAPGTEFDFGANFRGGYGGAAGGIAAAVVGSGGGGGGAIHIIADGNVTIFPGVTIFARGGKGGNSTSVDGAGGGGSGGAIWIESTFGEIINYGTLNLVGGDGGTNPTTSGDGGRGGDGVYQFNDINGLTTGSGLVPPTIFPTSNSSSLKSDISCGSIAKKNDNSMMFQMFSGFALAAFASIFLRRKTR